MMGRGGFGSADPFRGSRRGRDPTCRILGDPAGELCRPKILWCQYAVQLSWREGVGKNKRRQGRLLSGR